ncbi:MAG: hypothetical protein ACSHXK_15405 [Oceanococcus sp.]
MKAVFIELPAFEKWRPHYLTDESFRKLQHLMMEDPEVGDVISGAGGIRKMRFGDPRRGKGKRGGLRVIYYWWAEGAEFWLFTLYDKDEASDLTPDERNAIGKRVKAEIAARSKRK